MTDGTIQGLRHTAKAEAANAAAAVAKVAPTLVGKPGLRRREQRANLEAAATAFEGVIAAGEAGLEAIEDALGVLEDRKAAKKAAKGK